MELWLLALIALALIPTVRLFMADGCRRAAEPPGTEPLFIEVTASGRNPRGDRPPGHIGPWHANVEITDGNLQAHTPTGHPPLGSAVPRGGIPTPGREFPVTAEMFEGTESPYHWSANCTVNWECTEGPTGAVGRGTASATRAWDWGANRSTTVRFRLLLVADADPSDRDEETPDAEPDFTWRYRWELEPSGGE